MIPVATISQFASNLAGRPVTIECVRSPLMANGKTIPDARGWVWYRLGAPTSTIYLRMDVCQALQHAQDAPYDASVGDAMEILTHETGHASGIAGEVAAECWAHANVWQLVRQFRLPARAARWALDEADSFHSQLDPTIYHPETC